MGVNSFRVIFCFSILVVTFIELILFSITTIFSSVYLLGKSDHISNKPSFSYQYLRRNDENNETNYGYVTIPRKIGPNDFISYELDDNSQILVSNFGEVEYECFGTCFCEESQRRTVGSQILKGVSYLLVSISSIIAFERASSYFESKCIETLSEECQLESSIQSSVDDCSPILRKRSRDIITGEEVEGEDDSRVYFCYGNCVKNLRHKLEETLQQFRHMQCEKLKQEGEITISRSDNGMMKDKYQQTAVLKFQEHYLSDFCKKYSKLNYAYEGVQEGVNGKKYPRRETFVGYGCVARSRTQGGKKSATNNVKCRQIDPKPRSRNNKYMDRVFWERKEEWDKI